MHPASAGSPAHALTGRGRTVAVIPARYHSTRLPGKALLDLHGHPLIEHVYRRAEAARCVDEVLVATDDERIAAAVRAFGGSARLTRPDHPSGTDRLAEVAADLDCELIVNVQGDEPLIEPASIDAAVEPFTTDPHLTMSTLGRIIDDPRDLIDPHVVKVVVDRHGFALYFSRSPIPCSRSGSKGQAEARKHLGLYVYRRAFLLELARLQPTPLELAESLEQLRVLEHGHRIRVVDTRFDAHGVDTPDNLARVRRLMSAMAPGMARV